MAPLTTGGHPYPFRIPSRFVGKDGHVVLYQVRVVDRERLTKRLGALGWSLLSQIEDNTYIRKGVLISS